MNTSANKSSRQDVMAKRLDALYAELPTIPCQKKCSEACGPIFMGKAEWDRITDRLGYVPTRDLEMLAKRFKKGDKHALDCPMLAQGLCSVYDIRPMICRLWGLVPRMRCPYGCIPTRWLSDDEAGVFLRRAEAIGQPI